MNRPWSSALRAGLLLLALLLGGSRFGSVAWAAGDRDVAFDQANKLYEEGHYPEAAAAYEKLATSGPPDIAVYFNLGNACFKSGRIGMAVAAYHRALDLSPRDPGVRFNLQFARKAVSGSDAPPGRWWQRALESLTLNEWTILAAGALWLWFGLLAIREWRPALRPGLRGYTLASGVVLLGLALCAGAAVDRRLGVQRAVVVVPEAVVRVGPLDEAQEVYKFRDGTEVELLDRKAIAGGTTNQLWFQAQDFSGRIGWLKNGALWPLN